MQTSAWVRCLNTTFRESARTQVPCSSFCTGNIKMLHLHWCPCPSTEPGHQVWMQPNIQLIINPCYSIFHFKFVSGEFNLKVQNQVIYLEAARLDSQRKSVLQKLLLVSRMHSSLIFRKLICSSLVLGHSFDTSTILTSL